MKPIVVKMSFPDAMRAGAFLPQVNGMYVSDDEDGQDLSGDFPITGACALGSVGLSMLGGDISDSSLGEAAGSDAGQLVQNIWAVSPVTRHRDDTDHIEEDGRKHELSELIPHLNDDHDWPIERIAYWLDSIPECVAVQVDVIVGYELDEIVIEPWQDVVARIPDVMQVKR